MTSSVSAARSFQSCARSMESSHRPLLVLRAKIVMVGDPCVGKTALAQIIHSGGHGYPKNYIMTLGVDLFVKQIKVPDTDVAVELFLFDCAGQSIFNKVEQNSVHWQGSSLVCLVYDVSNRESFESCGRWLQGVRAAQQSSSPLHGVLIANKTDLRTGPAPRSVVSQEEGRQFARDNGLEYFETSALSGDGVSRPFEQMAQMYQSTYEGSLGDEVVG